MAINSPVTLGGVAVLALGVVGSLYASGSANMMPAWRFLSDDKEFWTTTNQTKDINSEYKNKFGGNYGQVMVGVGTPEEGATPESNEKWWKWSFKNRYEPVKSKTQGAFANLNDADALKGKCAAAYKEEINPGSGSGKIKATLSETNNSGEFKESDIWLFCSPAKEKIKTVADENATPSEYTHNTNLGGSDENAAKKDLVSTVSKSEGNKWFWKLINEEIDESDKATFFVESRKTMKDWCAAAYKRTGDASEPFTKDNMFSYCSLSGKEPSTTGQS